MDILYIPKNSKAHIRALQNESGLYRNFNEVTQTMSNEVTSETETIIDSNGNFQERLTYTQSIEVSRCRNRWKYI
jgi:hypothetical protein